jgi:hypothetical protein
MEKGGGFQAALENDLVEYGVVPRGVMRRFRRQRGMRQKAQRTQPIFDAHIDHSLAGQ